jgi:hypothetical protein
MSPGGGTQWDAATLAAYYDMECDGPGSLNLKDLSGNDLSGTLESMDAGLCIQPGIANTYSVLLDNASANTMYLIAGSSSELDFDGSSDLSFSFWIKPASSGNNRHIFAKQLVGSLHGFDCFMSFTNNLYVRFMDSSGNYRMIYQTVSGEYLTAGSWHHVSLVWNASAQTLAIYTNGTLSTVGSSAVGTVGSISNSDTFTLGKATRQTAGSSYTNGNIDEFAIYSGLALSSGDVDALYNGGTPPNLTGLLSQDPTNWWRMGDDASDDLTGGSGQVTDVAGSVDLTPQGTTSANKDADVPS